VFARQALYHLSPPPTLFALVIFQIGSCIYAQAHLSHNPPIYASRAAGMTGMHLFTE
jgi:hypothetical protein